MNLEQIIEALNEYLGEYPKAKVVYNIQAGKSNSVLIWSVYPEVYEEDGETFIVVSNKYGK